MWPNLVRTSTCDVKGSLVYGGDGTLEFLNGKDVKGSIVVLEYNSGGRWKNAAKLGAKAIVFIEPTTTIRSESEQKFSTVPLNVPRFYLPLKNAGTVLNAAFKGQSAHLSCRQDWVVRQSSNLIAEQPGTDPKYTGEPIVVLVWLLALMLQRDLSQHSNLPRSSRRFLTLAPFGM
jgi:hypothetical protein